MLSEILQRVKNQQEDCILLDCQGGKHYVHRFLLSLYCPLLKNLFTLPTTEIAWVSIPATTIVVEGLRDVLEGKPCLSSDFDVLEQVKELAINLGLNTDSWRIQNISLTEETILERGTDENDCEIIEEDWGKILEAVEDTVNETIDDNRLLTEIESVPICARDDQTTINEDVVINDFVEMNDEVIGPDNVQEDVSANAIANTLSVANKVIDIIEEVNTSLNSSSEVEREPLLSKVQTVATKNNSNWCLCDALKTQGKGTRTDMGTGSGKMKTSSPNKRGAPREGTSSVKDSKRPLCLKCGRRRRRRGLRVLNREMEEDVPKGKWKGSRFPCDQCSYVGCREVNLKNHKLTKHEGVMFLDSYMPDYFAKNKLIII